MMADALDPEDAGERGADGTGEGVMEFDDPEAGPVPAALVAVTLKEYEVPLVSPDTVQVRPVVVQVKDPGLEVTV